MLSLDTETDNPFLLPGTVGGVNLQGSDLTCYQENISVTMVVMERGVKKLHNTHTPPFAFELFF